MKGIKYKASQKGIVHLPLILIAVVGIIAFMLISSTAPFKNNLLSTLFPKVPSFAATGTINVDPTQTFQTIDGWEALSFGGGVAKPMDPSDPDYTGIYLTYRDPLFDKAIEMGINRFRVELVMPGPNQSVNCPLPVGSGFDFTCIDDVFDRGFIPYQQKLTSQRGEKIWLNITVVGSLGSYDTNEYVRRSMAVWQHIEARYGITPDSWEVALEPGLFGWTVANVGKAMIALGDALKAAGYTNLYFVAPSSECGLGIALNHYNQIVSNYPDVFNKGYFKEFAYHRYCSPSDSEYAQMVNIANQRGINTAQLEHGGGTHHELHDDLKKGNVSSWEAYGLADIANPNEPQYADYVYFTIDPQASTPDAKVIIRPSSKLLRQYFKFIRPDALRIGANSANTNFDPVAFINKDGMYVVVVKANGAGNFSIGGLPQGTYGIKYTTDSQYNIDAPDQTISANSLVNTSIPASGAITIYQKSGSTQPPPSATPSPSPTPTPPPALLLSTTLDSLTSITTPIQGTGTGAAVNTSPANDFVTGKVGNGVRIDAANEYVRFLETDGTTQNVELDQGTIDFWYQPSYVNTDGIRHPIISIGQWNTPGSIHIEKDITSHNNALKVYLFDALNILQQTEVPASSYSWNSGDWVNIRVTWDSKVSVGTQNVHIYINGIEKSYQLSTTGPFSMSSESATQYLYLGARGNNETAFATGVLDEVRVYNGAFIPGTEPTPSPTPSPSASPSPNPLPGDIIVNGRVDIFDYNQLLTDFGKSGPGLISDIVPNNRVDIFDYNLLLSNFGKSVP